jgi:hypothetical protein
MNHFISHIHPPPDYLIGSTARHILPPLWEHRCIIVSNWGKPLDHRYKFNYILSSTHFRDSYACGKSKPLSKVCDVHSFVSWLTLENHSSHISHDILDFCKKNYVILSFPPHCSQNFIFRASPIVKRGIGAWLRWSHPRKILTNSVSIILPLLNEVINNKYIWTHGNWNFIFNPHILTDNSLAAFTIDRPDQSSATRIRRKSTRLCTNKSPWI